MRGPLPPTLFLTPPGVEQAPTGHCQLLRWNWGTPIPFHLRGEDAKMPAPQCVADYHELRHLDPHLFASSDSCYIFVAGSADPTNNGLQGFFAWRPHSTEPDNGGTVIRPALPGHPPGRWHRVFDGAFSVKWFGAIGDGNSHPFSQRYATLVAAQADYPFVTSLNDEMDW